MTLVPLQLIFIFYRLLLRKKNIRLIVDVLLDIFLPFTCLKYCYCCSFYV